MAEITAPSNCDIDGNDDFYGLGIRLGFYLHWSSTLLVTIFNPEEEPVYRVVNLLLQIAVLTSLIFMTVNRLVYASEVMIAFWLLFGALSSLTGDGFSPFHTVAGLCRLALYAALSAYGCWFWFGGVDALRTPPKDCHSYVFFGGATPEGWFRLFGKVISTGGIVACSLMIVWSAFKLGQRSGLIGGAVTSMERGHRRSKKKLQLRRRPQTSLPLLALSLAIIALSIVSTETLIRDNSLIGVDDIFEPGQLIPLIVGAFGLGNTVLSTSYYGRLSKPRCLTLFGRHLT